MKKIFLLFLILPSLLTTSCKKENPKVEIQTYKGSIVVELDAANAPKTTGHFIKMVKDGVYDGASFYRSARGQVSDENPVRVKFLQGGIENKPNKPVIDDLPLETADKTGLKHEYLIFSMVNESAKTATEFLICLGDEPELDTGGPLNPDGKSYIPFGKVIAGDDIVQKVWGSPAMGEIIDPLVIIHKIKIRK